MTMEKDYETQQRKGIGRNDNKERTRGSYRVGRNGKDLRRGGPKNRRIKGVKRQRE